MSLYTAVHGENPMASELLTMLGLTKEHFGRYRDAFLNADGTQIIVYTRCGGGNREDYIDMFNYMEKHPEYDKDWDDIYDETYAYIRFNVPKKWLCESKKLATGKDIETVGEKFDRACKEMQDHNSEAYKKAEKIVHSIESQIEKGKKGKINIIGI